MPDTDRARAWLEMSRASDNILFQIFTMALAAVMLWEFARRVPEPGRGYMRLAFLSGTLGLYAYVVLVGALSVGGSPAALFVLGAFAGAALAAWAGGRAMANWDWRRPLRRRIADEPGERRRR